jgi:hypothetical protein
MKTFLKLLTSFVFVFLSIYANAQAPGGVVSGTAKGWRADFFAGNFSNPNQFGAGTANATPGRWAYTGSLNGTEFIGARGDNFGIEYTGKLAVSTAGTYTFDLSCVDDFGYLYIDGVLRASASWSGNCANSSSSVTTTLTAGDHDVKIKFFENLGGQGIQVFITGPSIARTELDGRFIRNDNAKLTAWYKATDVNVTANFGGAGIDRVNGFTNKAPDFTGNGDLAYGTGASTSFTPTTYINFNRAVNFDGDDWFRATNNQNGLSLRNAGRTIVAVPSYYANLAENKWVFAHTSATTTFSSAGIFKTTNGILASWQNAGAASPTSLYTANEPKLTTAAFDLSTADGATQNNAVTAYTNGTAGATDNTARVQVGVNGWGLEFGQMNGQFVNGALLPEGIYYPFALNNTDLQRIHTYLAVKYGISLTQDYINTSGTTIFSQTINSGFTNRIFGIGRELAAEALNQKQSQSQMASAAGYSFLVVSKGAVVANNANNTGLLADGDYMLLGDDNGALVATTANIPSSLSGGCAYNRISRTWKAQITGAPGAVTLRAGSATAGSLLFPASAAGVVLMVNNAGTAITTASTVTTYNAATVINGVATFNNVNIPNGATISFAWLTTAPGGVSSGLTAWLKADLGTSTNTNNTVNNNWTNLVTNANPVFVSGTPATYFNGGKDGLNFNPSLSFNGSNWYEWAGNFGVVSNNNFTVLHAGYSFNNGNLLCGTTVAGNGQFEQQIVSGNNRIARNSIAFILTPSTLINTPNSNILQQMRAGSTLSSFAGLKADGSTTFTGAFGNSPNMYIGARPGFASLVAKLSESVVYNRDLTTTEQIQVNSYLAIKYGNTLDQAGATAKYLASNGTTIIWDKITHWNNVFGIGRDDCSALNQRQSKSTLAGDNVAIGLNNINTTTGNEGNTGAFTTDKQFLVIGHDGGALTSTFTDVPASYPAGACNAARYAREWKAQNTGGVGPIQVTFGDNTIPVKNAYANPQLAIDIDGDGNFATGTVTMIAATKFVRGIVTFDGVALPDGAVFTLVWTTAAPGGVRAPANVTSINGTDHINGLGYKLYATSYGNTANISAGITGTLLSTGYVNNTSNFHNLSMAKIPDNFGIELTGKLFVPTTSSTYAFRLNADDQLALIIDGTVVGNNTAFGTTNYTNITLTAGYHDIIVRGNEVLGGQNFDVQWNGGSGATYVDIPDANFFTTVTGLSAWYLTDDNSLSANVTNNSNLATNATTYLDAGGNANDLTPVGTHNPTYYLTSNLRNYNPTIKFSDDKIQRNGYLNGFAYRRTARSVFSVGSIGRSPTFEFAAGYGNDAVASETNVIGQNAGAVQWDTKGGSNLTGPTTWWPNAIVKVDILTGIYKNSLITATNNAAIYANGLQQAVATRDFNTTMNDNAQLTIGNGPDYIDAQGWDGDLNEQIFYPWELTTVEKNKVESYLAIKWGVTLDQTTATNYVASNGSTYWSATTAATFNNDITGIGRDDCAGLYQRQSTSADMADIVAMARDRFDISNEVNTNKFTNDRSFLTWAHNNATNSFTNFSTNLPAVLTAPSTGCFFRLNRVWQVQLTNNPGLVSMEAGKGGVFNFNNSTNKPLLLISNSATDFSTATIQFADSVKKGKAYFSNINFTTGQYFTYGFIQAGPGGVVSGLTTWIDAGSDVYTDATQEFSADTDGEKAASVNNIAFNAAPSFLRVEQNDINLRPTFKASQFNFNPSLLFDGVNDVLRSVGNITTTDYRATTSMTSVLAGANYGTGNQNVFWLHDDNNSGNSKTSMERLGAFWSSTTGIVRAPIVTVPELYTYSNTTSGNLRLYSNLATVANNNTSNGNTNNVAGPFRIGSSNLSGGGFPANFDLGEFVIYSDDKGAATSTDMRKIHSYLAVKYGYTLDSTAMGNNYYASDNNVIYSYAPYWNRITGIGRDDCSALEQKQSRSIVAGALVTIANGTSGVAYSNATNPNGFSTNRSFNIFGDNNKPLTWTGVDNLANGLTRLNRVWRLQETGTVGTVTIEVPGNASTQPTKLPNSDAPTDAVYMIVANSASNGSFKGAIIYIEMIPDIVGGVTKWTTTYDFVNGDYFTFATRKLCIAPGGISDGLVSWYRADNKATGVIAATTGTLVDEIGTHLLTRNASGTATVIAGASNSFNYNKSITLTGNAALSKSGLNEVGLTSATEGTLYGAALTNTALFGTSRSNYNGVGVFANPTFANTSSAYGGTTISGVPNIWSVNQRAGNRIGATNGTSASTASAVTMAADNTYAIRIGTAFSGTTQIFGNNNFGEVFAYNRGLSDEEQQILNSYLALKYGQTLSHNYFTPDYDGTNASTSTIYDVSTYANRIFGVGGDTTGCFFQKQSTSQLAGSMLKISISNTIAAENTANTGTFAVDRSYVAAGDDNGLIATWGTGVTPAIYALANNCTLPQRIDRQWKFKAINNDQDLLITIPDNMSTATTKLPAVPSGAKVYMVINENPDFATNAMQQEVLMTLNTTTNEWETNYTFPNGVYKYVTFVYKTDANAIPPIAIALGTSEASLTNCNAAPYIYYRGTSMATNTKAIIAINPNGNTWAPTSLTVNNQGNLTGGQGIFTNTGTGYYQSTDGTNTIRVTKRLHSIVAPGTFGLNNGVIVRVFYEDADTIAMRTDAFPGSGTLSREGWFKIAPNTAQGVVNNMLPGNLVGGQEITPIAWGTDQGVRYAEFIVNSFSTFGYFTKTNRFVLAVNLANFTAKEENCKAVLKWTSGTEQNFNRYEVEFSKDGNRFSNVGTIKATGSNNNYLFTHAPDNSKGFYRLKMIDNDGKFKYSEVVNTTVNCFSKQIQLYPNPANKVININIASIAGNTTARVVNAIGQPIITKTLNAGLNVVNVATLPTGTYAVIVTDAQGNQTTHKVIVNH